jgi:hypothetical protein
MNRNKFSSMAIVLLLSTFFTTSWNTPRHAHTPMPILITAPFSYTGGSGNNASFSGPFNASGAISTSGFATMDAVLLGDGTIYHCVITLTDDNGSFTIHEQCQLHTNPWKGRWEIVSGTGIYSNLKGNGSNLMPATYGGEAAQAWEILSGVIY